MHTNATIEAPDSIKQATDSAHERQERTVLTRGGQPVAAIVPLDDFKLIEAIEEKENKSGMASIRQYFENEMPYEKGIA